MKPSLAIMASGLAMAARVCSSDRPWMITVPPAARASPNVVRVRRSPVDTSWCNPNRASGQVCQSSNSADWISVMPAPYGYASVVTSWPASRAALIAVRNPSISSPEDELTWTMCSAACAARGRRNGFLQSLEPAAHVDVGR